MRLSKIYTNLPNYFKPIEFNNGLNVVLGKITNLKDKNRDSHNLGKSLLIDVIDYCLLKQVHPNHFINKLPEILNNMEFYLEISLNQGAFLTIKRSIKKNTKICFKESSKSNQDFTNLYKDQWDHFELSLDKSKQFLDGKLNLTTISPFPYRAGISYFLRKQKDYADVFQVNKFAHGKHIEWKPYIGKILGFSSEVIKDKYECDNEVELKSKELQLLKNQPDQLNESLDKVRARIEAENQRINAFESKIDSFDFKDEDLNIGEKGLKKVEKDISYINNEIYNLNSDLSEISKSLETKILFKIENVKKIFKEVNLHFTDPVLKKYKELEKFNSNLTRDRKKRLLKERRKIEGKLIHLKEKLDSLNTERKSKLSILREKDSIKKYKKMQKELVVAKSSFQRLKNQLETLEKIKIKAEELNFSRKKLDEKIVKLKNEVEKENNTLKEIRSFFRELIIEVLSAGALLYVEINKENNMDFFAHYTKDKDPSSPTSEGEGTSYHKFLCAFFDLAVLRFYKNLEFYHFVYHDGILEGLDDRKKIALINILRKYAQEHNIQYILTVIESDLPYEDDKQFNFSTEEIIKRLTDEGEKGRLFNCPVF